MKEQIPSWLFFGIYNATQGEWNEENEKIAQCILKSLKLKAETNQWDISTIVHVEKNDNFLGYFNK